MQDQHTGHAVAADGAGEVTFSGKRASAWEYATDGTYVDRAAPPALGAAVVAVVLALCLLPFVGMMWARTDATTENRELAPPPALVEGESFNWNVLADSGMYFEDHFAYRNQIVSANARMRSAVGVAATDQVVVGNDGWLYYSGTLYDYLGQAPLSDRALRNGAHNLEIVQGYVEAHDARFAFTLAPNKNTLYPQHMPYYYLASPEESNARRFEAYLDEAGVNYVNLFDLYGETSGEWYLARDTHWTNAGALLGTQELQVAVGAASLPITPEDGVERDDFVGDMESMLYPDSTRTEPNQYFAGYNDGPGWSGSLWDYVEGSDVTDATISTSSTSGQGTLLMFRDSFGNALVPLMAPSYEQATFSKMVPYNVADVARLKADVVILERAERNLDYLATTPPLMPSPVISPRMDLPDDDAAEGLQTTLSARVDGPYVVLEGTIDQRLASDTCHIYVMVERDDGSDNPGRDSVFYDAFWKSTVSEDAQAEMDGTDAKGFIEDDFGYQVNMVGDETAVEGARISVFVVEDGQVSRAKTFDGDAFGVV